jgi:hypothetical protein
LFGCRHGGDLLGDQETDGRDCLAYLVRLRFAGVANLHVDPGVTGPRHLPDLVARAVVARLSEVVRRHLAGVGETDACRVVPHLSQDLVDARRHEVMVSLLTPRDNGAQGSGPQGPRRTRRSRWGPTDPMAS